MNFFRCLNAKCKGTFPADVRQRFCKAKCREEWHEAEALRKSSELWASLVIHTFDLDTESRITKLDNAERVQKAITDLAPAGAAFFRLGCPSPKENSESKMLVRWFPGPLQARPAVFRLTRGAPEPVVFDDPQVPYPGFYGVAYFTSTFESCGAPEWKVGIPYWQRLKKWYQGDTEYLLKQGRNL